MGDIPFPVRRKIASGTVVRARNVRENTNCTHSNLMAAVGFLLDLSMHSEIQTAEWCKKGFKGPFRRLRLPPMSNYTKGFRFLRVYTGVLQERTRFVWSSHIRTEFGSDNEVLQPWVQILHV